MLLNKVKATIKKFRLLEDGDKVLIGVSGGPDSVALAHILKRLAKEFNLSLHLAHLDHGIRKESRQDSDFVKEFGRKLAVPVTAKRIRIKMLSRKGSLEEIARECRLDFFCTLAKKTHADTIALGHTVDDQAETVLMRMLRGSGLYGLCAILPKRRILGIEVIRPLIETNRREIERYLKQHRLSWRIDQTNADVNIVRNKVRHVLLPLLIKEYNPRIKDVLARMAQSIGHDYDYLLKEANDFVKRAKTKVRISDFIRLHPAIKKMALRLLIARYKNNTRSIGFVHIDELLDLIMHRPDNSIVDLPGKVSAKKKGKYLYFYHRKQQ